jgi:hypothetical protein
MVLLKFSTNRPGNTATRADAAVMLYRLIAEK